ncbi:MAG: drug/metabolite transporter (DMT)-like permease [Alphaproteobacteria bacterium]|jgi:drug/metabolite transporter (DMT)-like permease
MPVEITLSILAAFFVGTSDFLVKMRSEKRHVLNALFTMSFLGMLFFGLYGLVSGYNIFLIKDYALLGWLAVAGVTNILALLCLYIGLSRGPVSVTAPLVTLSAVFLAIQWFFMGVSLSFYGYIGALIAIIGAVLLGLKVKTDTYSYRHILISAGLGLLAGFLFSVRLFIMQLISSEMHHSIVLTQARFFGLIFTLCIIGCYSLRNHNIFPKKDNFKFKNDIIYPSLQALFGSIGMILLLIASTGAYTIIAPTIFSINAGFTILWSALIFKEKITLQRIIAFIIIIIGITILKIYA